MTINFAECYLKCFQILLQNRALILAITYANSMSDMGNNFMRHSQVEFTGTIGTSSINLETTSNCWQARHYHHLVALA